MTLLITGANGFVGRNIVHHLSGYQCFNIIATDLQPDPIWLYPGVSHDIEYLSGDLSNKEFNGRLCNDYKFDCIIHLAAVISQAEDVDTYYSVMDSNIYTTFQLLETVRAHNARIIFPSTALVYGNNKAPFSEDMLPQPAVFYALSKHMSEELIRFYGKKYGINYLIFRIGVFYGTGQFGNMFIPSLLSKLLNHEEFAMTAGEQVRDFVHIDDFIDLLKRAFYHKDASGIFNVGTGHATALKDVALMAEELTGVHGKVKVGALPYSPNEIWQYCLDNSLTCRTFAWEPETSIHDGLARTLKYWQDHVQLTK